jgi:hypothetical protein
MMKGDVVIDDMALHWVLISEPQWSNSGDGYKSLCISVKVVGENRRELIIEYPFPKDRNGRHLPVPQRPIVSATFVERDIRNAIKEGWDTKSRGKAFVHFPTEGSSP